MGRQGSDGGHRPRAQPPLTTQLEAEISRLYVASSDREPTRVHAHLHPEFALCVLEGIFTTMERNLCESGHADVVARTRAGVSAALELPIVTAVEHITGRTVHARLSALSAPLELAVELFLFTPMTEEGELHPS